MIITDAELKHVTEALIRDGALIEAGFMIMMAQSWPGAGAQQTLDHRMCFFAGAQHVFASIMTTLDPGEEPTAADMERLDKIHNELDRFIKEYAAAHLPIQGNA